MTQRKITNLGQDWSYYDWMEYYVGRDNASYDCGIPFYARIGHTMKMGMTILGQDWLCEEVRMTILGQVWLCDKMGMTILRRNWLWPHLNNDHFMP